MKNNLPWVERILWRVRQGRAWRFVLALLPVFISLAGPGFAYSFLPQQGLLTIPVGPPPFSPASISGLAFWFEKPALYYSGGTWLDRGSASRTLTQATPSSQPSVSTSGDTSWLVFDGGDFINYSGWDSSALKEVWAVAKLDTGNPMFAGIVSDVSENGYGNYVLLDFSGSIGSGFSAVLRNNVATNVVGYDAWHVYAATGGPNTASTWTGIQLGRDRNYAGRELRGSIAAVVGYTSNLSVGDRALLQSYLAGLHP